MFEIKSYKRKWQILRLGGIPLGGIPLGGIPLGGIWK
jgi:hypothetical protein